MKVIADILLALLLKINVPVEKAEDIVEKVREKKMGLWFENFEPIDIQEEWRKLDLARAEIQSEKEAVQSEKEAVQSEKEAVQNEKKEIFGERNKLQEEKVVLKKEWEKFRTEVEEFRKRHTSDNL